jgi:hypothetical protein
MSATPFTRTQEMVEQALAIEAARTVEPIVPQTVLPPGMLEQWARCKHWIEDALEYDGGHYSIEDVWSEIVKGNATFWPGKRSAVVSQFWNFPKARTCNHWLAGGDMDELLNEMQPVIDNWARANGCTEVTIAGRVGWVRAMKPYGFEPIFTVIRKRL